MFIHNTRWYEEIRITASHILQKPTWYGDSVGLEGTLLGTFCVLGVSKGMTVIEVFNRWQEYRYSLFRSDKYLLGELPPDYVIPEVDPNDPQLILAQKQLYARLSMNYMDRKRACKNETEKPNFLLSEQEYELFDNESQKMTGFEYYRYFRNFPWLYGIFSSSFSGIWSYNNNIRYKPLFEDYHKVFSKAKHDIHLYYMNYCVEDPRNVEYVKSIFKFARDNHITYSNYCFDNFEPPFFWGTSFVKKEVSDRIINQILQGFKTLFNEIEPWF